MNNKFKGIRDENRCLYVVQNRTLDFMIEEMKNSENKKGGFKMSDCRGGLSLIEALLCVTYAAWLFEHPIPKVVMKYVNAYGIIAAIVFGLCLVAIIAIVIIKKRGA